MNEVSSLRLLQYRKVQITEEDPTERRSGEKPNLCRANLKKTVLRDSKNLPFCDCIVSSFYSFVASAFDSRRPLFPSLSPRMPRPERFDAAKPTWL